MEKITMITELLVYKLPKGIQEGLTNGKYKIAGLKNTKGKLFNEIVDVKTGKIVGRVPVAIRSTGKQFVKINELGPLMQSAINLQKLNLGLSVVNIGLTIGLYFFIHYKFKQLEKIINTRFDRLEQKMDYIIHILKSLQIEGKMQDINDSFKIILDFDNLKIKNQDIKNILSLKEARKLNNRLDYLRLYYRNFLNPLEILQKDEAFHLLGIYVFSKFALFRAFVDLNNPQSALEEINSLLWDIRSLYGKILVIEKANVLSNKESKKLLNLRDFLEGTINRISSMKMELDIAYLDSRSFIDWERALEERILEIQENTDKILNFIQIGVPEMFSNINYASPEVSSALIK